MAWYDCLNPWKRTTDSASVQPTKSPSTSKSSSGWFSRCFQSIGRIFSSDKKSSLNKTSVCPINSPTDSSGSIGTGDLSSDRVSKFQERLEEFFSQESEDPSLDSGDAIVTYSAADGTPIFTVAPPLEKEEKAAFVEAMAAVSTQSKRSRTEMHIQAIAAIEKEIVYYETADAESVSDGDEPVYTNLIEAALVVKELHLQAQKAAQNGDVGHAKMAQKALEAECTFYEVAGKVAQQEINCYEAGIALGKAELAYLAAEQDAEWYLAILSTVDLEKLPLATKEAAISSRDYLFAVRECAEKKKALQEKKCDLEAILMQKLQADPQNKSFEGVLDEAERKVKECEVAFTLAQTKERTCREDLKRKDALPHKPIQYDEKMIAKILETKDFPAKKQELEKRIERDHKEFRFSIQSSQERRDQCQLAARGVAKKVALAKVEVAKAAHAALLSESDDVLFHQGAFLVACRTVTHLIQGSVKSAIISQIFPTAPRQTIGFNAPTFTIQREGDFLKVHVITQWKAEGPTTKGTATCSFTLDPRTRKPSDVKIQVNKEGV